MYKVFVKTDLQSRVTAVNSDVFIPDPIGWVQIDEGDGDKYHHAQGNYLPKSIMTMRGVYQYKLVDGKAVERTSEEIAVDIALIPSHPPTVEEIIKSIKLRLDKAEQKAVTAAADIVMLKGGKVDKA